MGTNAKGNTNVKHESPYKSVESFLSGETTLKSAAQYDFAYEKEHEEKEFHCDGCGKGNVEKICILSRDIYRILWKWNDNLHPWKGKQIVNNYGKCEFDNINDFSTIPMGPDTMNSFSTTNGVAKEVEISQKLKEKFKKNSHSIGNFVLVPARFNGPRGISPYIKDYWDLSLFYLKKYGHRSCNYRFDEKSFKPDDFNIYINIFFLWDYVVPCNVEKQYVVKSLFTDKFWTENYCGEQLEDSHSKYIRTNGQEGSVMPQLGSDNNQDSEIKIFLENINWAIYRRGIFMVAMLKIAKQCPYVYTEIQKKVFLQDETYSGYGAVFEKINDILKNLPKECDKYIEEKYGEKCKVSEQGIQKIHKDVKGIIDEAKKMICHSQTESSRK